jgi:biopolymer transport protein ExbD
MKRFSSLHLPCVVAEISVMSLLNLVLLMLLTVIVLVPVMQDDGQAGDFDSGRAAMKPVPVTSIELGVETDLKLTLAGKRIEQGDLIAALKKRLATEPDLGVVVRIPPSLAAPRLLEIMDALRAASVRHTAVTAFPVTKS